MKKAISLLLCMILCLGLCIPAFAYNDDVTVSAKLDQATLDYDADNDRTVELTVSLSKEVQLFSFYLEADVPDDLTLSGIASDIPLGSSDYSLTTGVVSWFDAVNHAATKIAVLTVTVPKGTAVGSYKIGVKEIELATEGENGDNNWMEGGTAYATLKIKEAAAPTYTVKFDANGGKGTMADVTGVSGDYKLPACKFTAPEGKQFKVWSVDGKEYAAGKTITVTADVTVKAVWEDIPAATYTVKFDANGGTGTMADVTVKEGDYKLPACKFTAPEDKQFKAWSVDGKEYAAGKTIKVTADVTVKAIWEDIPAVSFTVSFDANGGTGTMADVKVEEGSDYTLPECTFTAPEGQQFKAWSVDGKEFAAGKAITVTADVTVKAVWEDVPAATFTVSFDANGGTGTMADVTVNEGNYKLPACGFTAPEGKQFKAWSVNGKEYAAGKTIKVTADVTVKAVWEDIPAVNFTVSFDANGGTGKMADVKVEEGSDYTLPECGFTAPEGQQYKAWGLGSNEFQPGDVYRIDADTTFMAIWEEIPELVTVRFHLNGGKASGITDGKEVTFYADEEGDSLPRATKSGFSFNGWYDAEKGGKKYTTVSAKLPADLYAQWSENKPAPSGDDTITVSFRLIGAELASKDVDLGAKEYMPDYVTWVATTSVELDEGATVYDLWVKATDAAGISSVGASKNYVETVYAPKSLGGYALSEFTNGRRSGWMYTINGSHPGFGLKEQPLRDGDRVIWHYVNDFSYEVDDWAGDAKYPSLGDGSYWNRWLMAPDRLGGKGGGLSEKKDSGSDAAPVVKGSTITVTPEVKNGAADAAVDADTVKEALKNTRKGDTLTVIVATDDADDVKLTLPADAVKAMANGEVNLRVDTENGAVKLDADAVSDLAATGREIAVAVRDNADGSTTFDVTADGRSVDATIKVELPAAKNGQVLVAIQANGTQEIVKKSIVENGKVYAEISAGTKVKLIQNAKNFADVAANAWYKGAVDFASSHELFNGVSDTAFAPSMPMTRAMLATVLFRLEGAIASGTNPFADVPNGTWYTDAVIWANANGIVMGTDKGFEPNVNITREQIATMLFRYAKLLGIDTSGRSALNGFVDGDKTSSWAGEAMQWAVSAGLFKGDNTNALNPKGDATRAEVATLMQRLVGLIVK